MYNTVINKLKILNKLQNLYSWFKARPYLLTFSLFMVLLFGLGLYIFQVNSTATLGHRVKELEKNLYDMQEQHDTYLVQAAELRSMNRIEKGIKALDLQKISNKSYVDTAAQTVFAQR